MKETPINRKKIFKQYYTFLYYRNLFFFFYYGMYFFLIIEFGTYNTGILLNITTITARLIFSIDYRTENLFSHIIMFLLYSHNHITRQRYNILITLLTLLIILNTLTNTTTTVLTYIN